MIKKKRPTRWLELFTRVFMTVMLLALLQGCFDVNKTQPDKGYIAGTLPVARNSWLVADNGITQTRIAVNDEGSFAAQLPTGRYQLLMQTGSTLTLIKRDVQVENNLTLTIVDLDMVPIPQVKSVSVPLLYSTSAVIEWETDIESDGRIEYGTNELYGHTTHADSELRTRHRLQLYNLQPATTYHFRIVASRYSLESAQSISRNYSFTTEP